MAIMAILYKLPEGILVGEIHVASMDHILG